MVRRIPSIAVVLATLVSATLAFCVQPVVAKVLLPVFGGSASVWTAASIAFQITLVCGYLFALRLAAGSVKVQIMAHSAVIIGGAAVFVAAPARLESAGVAKDPAIGVAALVLASSGLLLAGLWATGPLCQRWNRLLGDTVRPGVTWYAFGSLANACGLMAYPMFVEPMLDATETFRLIAIAALLVPLLCWSAFMTGKRVDSDACEPRRPETVLVGGQLFWLCGAAVSTILVLGLTTHLSTDVAAIPLFWVVPLTVYLLFSATGMILAPFASLQPQVGDAAKLACAVVLLLLAIGRGVDSVAIISLHLLAVGVLVLAIALKIARFAPSDHQVTRYYLFLGIGGVIGSVVSAIVVPLVFSDVVEYPLAIVLTGLAISQRPLMPRWRDLAWPTAVLAGVVLVGVVGPPARMVTLWDRAPTLLWPIAIPLAIAAAAPLTHGRLAMSTAVVAVSVVWSGVPNGTSWVERTFYGIHRVVDQGESRLLYHGTTLHGVETAEGVAYTYYEPVAELISSFPVPRRLAVIGLGTGTIAAFLEPEDEVSFFELDATVIAMSGTQQQFTYLSKARERGVRTSIIQGDGRLMLRKSAMKQLDVVVIDAFSSDAIPVHLLTREAIRDVMAQLGDDGVVAVHISNRYLNLEPVLAAAAKEVGALAFVARGRAGDEWRLPSVWIMLVAARAQNDTMPWRRLLGLAARELVRTGEYLAQRTPTLVAGGGAELWRPANGDTKISAWSDQTSSLLSVFSWR